MLYNGTLSVYFPCKLKETSRLRSRQKMIKRAMERQYRYVVNTDSPLTDLMDKNDFREEKEIIFGFMGESLGLCMTECSPCALPCLQEEYRSSREDGQFAKNTNTVLSRFKLEYDELTSGKDGVEINGILLYNINWDNAVGTAIVVLNFKNLSSNDLILLKHLFYKRAKVKITEYSIRSIGNCRRRENDSCFKCVNCNPSNMTIYEVGTLQEYVMKKIPICKHKRDYPVGARARYSLMEIDEPIVNRPNLMREKIIYSILCADEGWQHAVNYKRGMKNISRRDCYDFYISGCNGLIVTNRHKQKDYVDEKNAFFKKLIHPNDYIEYIEQKYQYCIAGMRQRCYPSFLKTVELHYLMNIVATSEIIEKKHSYFNPYIFIKRGLQLWKIIHELDINLYYHNNDFLESFGVRKYMEDITNEYKFLLQHGTNYLIAVLTILTLFTSIL